MDVEEGLSLKKKERRDKGVPPSRDGSRNKLRYREEALILSAEKGGFFKYHIGRC